MNDIISGYLKKEIMREIMIKNATKSAQVSYEKRKQIARRKIEDFKQKLEISHGYELNLR